MVFFLTWLVAYLIPDVPAEVKQLMLREVYLAKEARYTASFVVSQDEKTGKRTGSEEGEDDRQRLLESEAKVAWGVFIWGIEILACIH